MPSSAYIKSILPERMKIKLVLIDVGFPAPRPQELTYYIDPAVGRISRWIYSPPICQKVVETDFEMP